MIEASVRNSIDAIHRKVIYPWLISGKAQDDREIAHERALNLLEFFENKPWIRSLISSVLTFTDPILESTPFKRNPLLLETTLPNPLGVAAGFDKNGRAFQTLGAMGFGFVEIGSITTIPYLGNPRPRIFVHPQDFAITNRMGFPGDGLQECYLRISQKLATSRQSTRIGINIGASRPSFERVTAVHHYFQAYVDLSNLRPDYLVYNLSSPNTPGVRGMQERQTLDQLLTMTDKHQMHRPILLIKISPDLTFEQLDDVLTIASDHHIDGIIATNTTTNQDIRDKLTGKYRGELGGISGKPLTNRALEISRYIYNHTEGKLPIIRAGGIMSFEDLWDAITIGGASLVQVYTALVDRSTSSPLLAYKRTQGLARTLKYHGFKNVSEAVGSRAAQI